MLVRTLTPFVGHDTGVSFPPTVGRYRIDRVLGSGAFASVWLGHDDALASQVAIKVLSGSLLDDLDVRNRFLEEARILRRADSERLVRVHDIGELPDGRPYFVMSYADRGTLADRMRERPLPVTEAVAMAEEIAYGVEVINTLGVIHRDLKPSNVLFQSTPDGGEKLLIADLGLAKALAHASGAFTLPVGTPGYMSPEQARFGGGLDVRADVYGLGALTYHMLTGRAPGPAPVKSPPSELREGLSPAFDQVVLRALEVEREKRWPTAEAFAEALSTLRPTTAPGPGGPAAPGPSGPGATAGPGAAPSYSPPAPPAPRIEPDATVQDFYHDGARQDRPPAPVQPPGPGQTMAAGPGPSPQNVPQELRTRLDQPQDDDVRTSEMRLPAGAGPVPGGGEQTIMDEPAGRLEPPTSPDDDRTRAFGPASYPPSQPPVPAAPQGGDNKTTVFPTQPPPQQGSPQGPPQGAPMGPPGPPGQGQFGPPPTGFQPPPGPESQGRQGKGGGLLGRLKGGGAGAGRPSGPGGTGGGGAPRKFVTPLIITAVVLALALVVGLTLGMLSGGGGGGKKSKDKTPKVPTDFVAIADPSGKIKTAVPKTWPKQQEQTWVPTTVHLNDAGPRPVLRATPSLQQFLGNGTGPGVFIGLTTDVQPGHLPPPTAAVHAQCTKAAPENYTSPDGALTGTITRFTACKSGTPSVTEVGLKDKAGKFGLWIRVKETDNRNATKDILDNLKVTGP
ncbi:protein kinase [Actinomadura sp. LD22]|uniref:non-specific serine/threonine protein kinase n=1 Tax=Actinomadura physcomitrii TaxID=2650748 RepID=A0A6I4MUE7_9ACTN|nr:protein kinase [Actinomadura physcomitrii]